MSAILSTVASAVAAAAAPPPFLVEVALLVAAAALVAYVSFRLGMVPIVGFLIAGVLIGPNALGLVGNRELVDAAAEVGVILLLFTIGIEFSLERLARIRRLILGGGGLQVGLTAAATMGILAALGVDWKAGLFTGFLVALSSTAIVLKLLSDRGETTAPHGQVGLGLLIFQDLAVVAMVLTVPMLAGEGGSAVGVGWALGKAALVIVAVLVLARRLMSPVLEIVQRTCSPELFLLSVVAICFGTAYLTSLAGVSVALGAFLAGLIVSESRFSEHAMAEILPLQVLFSATFFVSIGMLLDPAFLLANLPLVLGVVAAVLALKVLLTGASAAALGHPVPVAAASALLLGQMGEFSFVLERAGREFGLFPAGMAGVGSQTFIAATVLLMIATPFLARVGTRVAGRLEERRVDRAAERMAGREPPEEHAGFDGHVIVAGYGEAARRLVRVLRGSGIKYVITTLNPGGAEEAEREGLPVLRGDASRARTLRAAGVEGAKLLVVADDQPRMAARIVSVARSLNPTMRIVVRTRYLADAAELDAVGSDRVVTEEMEGVVALLSDVMRAYAISPERIQRHEDAVRAGDYAAFLEERLAEERPPVVCELDRDCLDVRTVGLRAGAPAAGRSLAELRLPGRYGIDVRSVRRDGEVLRPPPADFVVRAGDELELHGDADAFVRAAPLFRVSGLRPPGARVPGREDSLDRRAVDTERTIRLRTSADASTCSHLGDARPVRPGTPGCEECLRAGDRWVHLRVCMSCGHVGCCDSSPNRHASRHHAETGHPIVKSLEPGEDWGWCYVDEAMLEST